MRRRTRDIEVFSLSFLDIISCAFGAIILILLVIRKGDEISEQNFNISKVEENILENLNVMNNIEKLKAENKLLNAFIKDKSANIEIINSKLEDKKTNRK